MKKSQRGGVLLSHNGYLYVKNKLVKDSFYWDCKERSHKKLLEGCKGRAITMIVEGQHIIQNIPVHNHAPDIGEVARIDLRETVKLAAKGTSEKPVKLIQSAKANVSVNLHPYLPTNESLRKAIHHARKGSKLREPANVLDLQIPSEITLRSDGLGSVLVRDINKKGHRILIFSSLANITELSKATYAIGDGTFKSSPALFRQLYSIHAPVGGKQNRRHIPLIYALMNSKSQECYKLFVQELMQYMWENDLDWSPKFFISDFEIAVLNVVSEKFPGCEPKTCLFHLGQIIWRQVQKQGLATWNRLKLFHICEKNSCSSTSHTRRNHHFLSENC